MKKKSCTNCSDYIVCLQNTGKEPTEVCEEWDLELNEFQELFKGKHLYPDRRTAKEIDTIINQKYK